MRNRGTKKKKTDHEMKQPFFRVLIYYMKFVCIGAVMVALIVIIPISFVKKEVYRLQISMNHDRLVDSVAVLRKKIATATLKIETLAKPERIEQIGKNSLGLDYPSAEEIIVVHPKKKNDIPLIARSKFWMLLRRSLMRGTR